MKELNFAAGTVRSMLGPLGVNVRMPVDWIARSVDWSECVIPGVWPGGSPLAFPQNHPTMSGWIVAAAAAQLPSIRARTTTNMRLTRFIGSSPL